MSTNALEGAPESAVVAISETPDLCIVIASFRNSRKNRNIEKDDRVSVVVGWSKDESKTLQIEGHAEIVVGEERERLEVAHCKKNPPSLKYKNDVRQEYIKIKPSWVRYSDFSVDPQEVWEVVEHPRIDTD